MKEGYTNIRRYRLGIPAWRALGGITQIEPWGVKHVFKNDGTAVFLDIRTTKEFALSHISNTKNLPHVGIQPGKKDVGEIRKAKNDGRLPYEDHNTRIIVFGESKDNASRVAEALAKEGFHNVSFFSGNYLEFKEATGE